LRKEDVKRKRVRTGDALDGKKVSRLKAYVHIQTINPLPQNEEQPREKNQEYAATQNGNHHEPPHVC